MTDVASRLEALGFVVDNLELVRASIVAFQRRAGLVVDGIAGPLTQQALERMRPEEVSAGLVTTADVTVDGMPFVQWFETVRIARPTLFPYALSPQGFATVFDHASLLGMGVGLTIAEFIALLTIFYNETGGSLRSVAEYGGLGYCFGTNGGKKASYNTAVLGNRLAGDLLAARGILKSHEEITRWNGTTWPDPPVGTPLYEAAAECDFFKFRGHGLCQITWRNGHAAYVDPAIGFVSDRTSEQMSTAELDAVMESDPVVYCLATALFFHDVRWAAPALAAVNHGDFHTLGRRVSGSAAYATLYALRCKALLEDARGAWRVADHPPMRPRGRASPRVSRGARPPP